MKSKWAILIVVSVVAAFTGLSVAEASPVTLKAGTAKVVISNKEPLVMTNGRLSTGILKDIHARALVLNDGTKRLVIITYGLNCLDVATPILRSRLRKEMGIEPEYLVLLATHNHNGPIQIVPDNFEYGRRLAGTLVDLVKEAIQNETGPARLHFGSGDGYFLAASGNAPVDYEIQVLKVMTGEKPLAVLFNQGVHPLQSSFDKIEPGHPGYAMDNIEAALPGVQAMYADASGGNQFPRVLPEIREKLAEARKKGPEYANQILPGPAKALAKAVSDVVLKVVAGPMQDVTGPISSRMEVLSLPLAPPISRAEAEKLAESFPADVGLVPYPNRYRSTNWVRVLLDWYDRGLPFPTKTTEMVCTDDTYMWLKTDQEMLDKYDYSLHDELPCVYEEVIVAQIGPMPLVAMQGEVCAPIGMRIKDAFRHERPIMVFGYMGEHNLYIPTRELVRLNAYQAKVIHIQYGSPVGWAPEVEDEMVAGVIRIVRSGLGMN